MYLRKPDWLKIKIQSGHNKTQVEEILQKYHLHTVCEQANCPNLMECFCRKTATFMILGTVCSRNCTFCNVEKGTPLEIDQKEPENIAKAVREMSLKHVVITSVTRDDLPDGGVSHFVRVIEAVRKINDVVIEVLVPDFLGDFDAMKQLTQAHPNIINHNVWT